MSIWRDVNFDLVTCVNGDVVLIVSHDDKVVHVRKLSPASLHSPDTLARKLSHPADTLRKPQDGRGRSDGQA